MNEREEVVNLQLSFWSSIGKLDVGVLLGQTTRKTLSSLMSDRRSAVCDEL